MIWGMLLTAAYMAGVMVFIEWAIRHEGEP